MAVTGSGATLQIGKESAWGTAAAGAKIIDFTSESIKLAPDKKVQDSLIASKAAPAKDLMGLQVQGDTAFVLRPEYAGFLFKAMLGGTDTVSANSPVNGAHTHTIPLADANGGLPSYTLIIDRKAAVKKYAGCKVASWSLDAKVGDYVKGSISWMGKDESTGSLASLSPLALQAFKVVSATCTIGGTSYDVKSVSLKGDNKLEDVGQTFASGLYHLEPVHGMRELTVDIEMNYDSAVETLHDNYSITGTVINSIVIELKSPSIVTGSTQYQLTLTINNVSATVERGISGTGLVTAKLSGSPTSVGATEPVTAAIIDASSSAY